MVWFRITFYRFADEEKISGEKRAGNAPLNNSRAENGELAIERGHAGASVADIVEFGLGNVRQDVLARLDEAPQRPHRMRRRAPCGHGVLECDELALVRRGG